VAESPRPTVKLRGRDGLVERQTRVQPPPWWLSYQHVGPRDRVKQHAERATWNGDGETSMNKKSDQQSRSARMRKPKWVPHT